MGTVPSRFLLPAWLTVPALSLRLHLRGMFLRPVEQMPGQPTGTVSYFYFIFLNLAGSKLKSLARKELEVFGVNVEMLKPICQK